MSKTKEPQSLLREAAAVTEERAEAPGDQIRWVRRKIDPGHTRLFLKLLVPLSLVFVVISVVVIMLVRM